MPTPSTRAPQRLAIVASYAPSLINFRLQLLKDIRAAGHEVLCLAPDFDERIVAELAAAGFETAPVPLERTGLNPLADVTTVKTLAATFRTWKPDVVTGYTPKAAIYSAIAGRAAGVPRRTPMVTGLGYAFLKSRSPKVVAVRHVTKMLYRRAFRAATGAIFQNTDDLAQLEGLKLLPKDLPISIVGGSGVDMNQFAATPLPPLDGAPTFLLIARLVRYKGIFEYCEAARILKAQGKRARFLLVGPTEGGPAGFSAAELEHYKDDVTYLGPKDDVRPLLRDCHVYVLPSYGEGMPRTVLEALATGRPIVTTNANGCRDTIDEGVNGFMVPVGDAAALAAAMARFIDAPALLAPMAEASRLKCARQFDVRVVNEGTRRALGLD